jgi:hypothetical protein
MGLASGGMAWPEPSSGLGLEISGAHEPCDVVAAHLEASSFELLMNPWSALEAAVAIKHHLHQGGDG